MPFSLLLRWIQDNSGCGCLLLHLKKVAQNRKSDVSDADLINQDEDIIIRDEDSAYGDGDVASYAITFSSNFSSRHLNLRVQNLVLQLNNSEKQHP